MTQLITPTLKLILIKLCLLFFFYQANTALAGKLTPTALDQSQNEKELEVTQDIQLDQKSNKADELLKKIKEQRELMIGKTRNVADQSQQNITNRLFRFSSYVDNFYSTPEFENENKQSRMRVSFANTIQRHENPSYKPRLNLSLALPNTQQRLKLRLQSISDNELADETNEESPGESNIIDSVAKNSFSTALGIVLLANKYADIQSDIGVKLRTPPNPFSKLRIRRSFHFYAWELRLTETFLWQKSDGKSATSRMNIEYPINEKYFFRTSTRLTYWDEDSYISALQAFTIFEQKSPLSVIAYSIGANGQNENDTHDLKHSQVNNYWAELRYRKNFYKDWLFYETNPGLIFPKSNDYHLQPRLTVKLEAIYGRV